MFNVGPTELLVILALALMVFGPKRLPEMSRQIGRGLREFRRATQDVQNELQGVLSLDDDDDEPAKPVSSNGSGPPKAAAEDRTNASAEEPVVEAQTQTETQVRTQTPPTPPVPGTDASKNGSSASNGHTVIDPAGD
jgi:sec-independent protein translocase protein TatA